MIALHCSTAHRSQDTLVDNVKDYFTFLWEHANLIRPQPDKILTASLIDRKLKLCTVELLIKPVTPQTVARLVESRLLGVLGTYVTDTL